LTRNLDRVYGIHLVNGVERAARPINADLSTLRRQRGVGALERALDDLHQLRERSQGAAAIKDELDCLHSRIVDLRTLSEATSRLRLRLAEPSEGGEGPRTLGTSQAL